MKVLRTLVVEDEGPARRRLEKMVEGHPSLHLIESSAESGEDALRKIERLIPDLILLDIELKDYNAFDILSKISPLKSRIIFVTAFNSYAVKAFEIEAVDYLLKPYSEDRFIKAVEKAINRDPYLHLEAIESILEKKEKENSNQIIIPEGNTQHFLKSTEIEYIYSQGYYINLVMGHQKKLIRISLKQLEIILPSKFIRINKSTIVNKDQIKEIIRNKNSLKIVMSNQIDFYVTEKYRGDLNFS